MNRFPNQPFEKLEEFSSLTTLVNYILNSVAVREIKVRMYGDIKTLRADPLALLPIRSIDDIIVGNATFPYIRHQADYIMKNVKERIRSVNENSLLSFGERFKEFEAQKKSILRPYQYFNSMNLVRFMSSYQWGIVISETQNNKQEDKIYPCSSSCLDLQNEHWNYIQNNFYIRRDLLSEIMYLLDVELENLKEELGDTKYTWIGDNWKYEITELILGLLNSRKIEIIKGSEKTFIRDFLSFFEKADDNFPYLRGKVLERAKRSKFLLELGNYLETYGKSSEEKMTI